MCVTNYYRNNYKYFLYIQTYIYQNYYSCTYNYTVPRIPQTPH